MRRKTIDDYRLEYLKVLFEIRLIFFMILQLFVICLFNNFLFFDSTDRRKISSNQKR